MARVRTPTILQMEAVECGAAALGIILGYYGRHEPLEVLRVRCGVSRDGSRASNIVRAARALGMEAKGFKREPEELRALSPPFIVFWNFNHFVVVEGFGKELVYLNDPACGPRRVSAREFDEAFTGVVLVLRPGPEFQRGGAPKGLLRALGPRLRGSRLALVYLTLTGLLLVFPGLLVPTFARVLIDDVLIAGNRRWVMPMLLAMALTAALRASLTYLLKRYLGRLETKLALAGASQFLWHVLRLPCEFFQQRFAGDITARVTASERVARLLSGDLATNLVNLLMVGFYGALMLAYDRVLCALGLAVAMLNIVLLRWVARLRGDESRRMQQDRGRLSGVMLNGLQLIETLKASGAEGDFFARWAGYQAKVLVAEQRLGAATQALLLGPPLLTALGRVAVLGLGALRVMDGRLSMGEVVAFESLMLSFLQPIGQLVRLGARLQELQGDLSRLDDVLRHEQDPDLGPAATPGDGGAGRARLSGHVELRGVTFGHSRLEPPLLSDFNLVLRPGSRVALVGGSGSGKSTVARLVAGLHQPWAGEILFDGRPRRHIDQRTLRAGLAMVDQDIFLFEGTVRENLTLWDGTVPEAQVVAAARDAAIHDDVALWPGGYDARIEEGGRNLSGGQRQRLELARALVQQPSILILDEATSALDPLTEQLVDRSLRRRGCTCLIIAHRLSTIRDCDEIIVLERGRVVERGTHEELLRANGAYAALIRTS